MHGIDAQGNTATATAPATVSVSLPVCTRTVTGTVRGTIVVPSGVVLCLKGATALGAIIVQPGGGVISTNSTISGARVSNGAQVAILCGSTVRGSVLVRNSAPLVRVGDDDNSCAPSDIRGSLLLLDNHAGVEVFGNSVRGAVLVRNNQGAAFPSDAIPEVEGNHIVGSLNCSGNTPPPTNGGVANTVRGAKFGQCAHL